MNAAEIKTFIKTQLLPRWPEYKPISVELSDLAYIFEPTDEITALKAVREHAIESNWKYPKLKRIKDNIKAFSPKPPPQVKIQQPLPEPTVFVGLVRSDTTLLPGYFVPVELGNATADKNLLRRSAEGLMERLKNRSGGEWKIFEDVNCGFMTKWRFEIRQCKMGVDIDFMKKWIERRKLKKAAKISC